MSKPEEDRAYMEEQQQLFVAAKVNRLCEATYSNEMDIDTYVSYAQDIVDALDPRLKPTSSYGIKFIRRLGGRRKSFVGATELGNMSASYIDDKTDKTQTEEYRIGNYIARKRNRGDNNAIITLEHYLAKKGVRTALQSFPQATAIRYEQGSLDLHAISTCRLVPITIGNFIIVLSDHYELMWKQNDAYKQQRALNPHTKRYPHRP